MPASELIAIRNANVVRDGRAVLTVEDLALRAREHVAILGSNGAGKSTLIGLITRDVLPLAQDRTAVLLGGRDRWDLFEARRVFGLVSDTLQAEYLRHVSVLDTVLSGYFGSVGLHRKHEVTSAMIGRANELLDFLGIAGLADRMMDTLSTGETRRALIGRALVHDPELLILDEPTHGLDPGGTYHFLGLLRTLAASGHTLVVVTHHVSDIIPEVDRVIMLKDGRVVDDGPKAHVLTSTSLSALYDVPTTLEERQGWYRLW